MVAIQTKELCKNYGQALGIKNVSLEVEQGEIFGFIGPNGAGKSTFIRTLLGLLIPTSGSANIFGHHIGKLGSEMRKDVGYLPSEVHYYDVMSARELLEYHCRFYNITDYSEIQRLASIFELDLDKQITDLSFGNRKKCGIVQCLVHKPKLIIMDEPTSGLDPLMQVVFFDLLKDLNKSGTTIFFSSHILSEVQNLCHRAAIIKHGEIVATEHIQSLLKKQMKKAALVFRQKPMHLNFPVGVQSQRWNGNKLTFEYVGDINTFTQWLSTLDIQDISLEEPALESIFMNYYEHDVE